MISDFLFCLPTDSLALNYNLELEKNSKLFDLVDLKNEVHTIIFIYVFHRMVSSGYVFIYYVIHAFILLF